MANNMSDEELDRNWQPNGRRPQSYVPLLTATHDSRHRDNSSAANIALPSTSTIARSFSAELMDIFRIENSVADLDKEVNERSVPSLDCPCILPSPLLDLTTHALAANDSPATTTTSLQHNYTCILLLPPATCFIHTPLFTRLT
jgi:hypothetical protein